MLGILDGNLTDGQEMGDFPDIPVIDYSRLGTSSCADDLADACSRFGFFELVNHGLTVEDTTALFREMHRFFAMPAEEKVDLKRTSANPLGYYDQELTKNRRDWKEIFDLAIDQPGDQRSGTSQWPMALKSFRTSMVDWLQQCEIVSFELLNCLCRTLGQEGDSLNASFSPVNSSFLRLNHYPICASPADATLDNPQQGHLGIYHHTDAGALTVLKQDMVSGLQFKIDGNWHTIHTEADVLVINIGDLMQVWSNNRYKSPVHRVTANKDSARYSAAFFFNPTFDCNCEPLNKRQVSLYKSVNWGEFRRARAAGDYSNLGEEAQISDWLR